ncbi:unnamed protein product [Peronospora belbahrii]|uniref:Acyltransferase n=1 Tax=Peronospora belbahrii TaxID=622444 RepID=A0AAU9L162_9STRA|nr:unnamed protein product [Peronospora belbahrii]CAH0517653.1 unnamed protein product [Peronospora belbahrii]
MSQIQWLKNSACSRTPTWPNFDARPNLRTLQGRFVRRFHLTILYGLWVLGLLWFLMMWIFSLFYLVQWVWGRVTGGKALSMPLSVQIYLISIILHKSYHYLTRLSLHQWPFIRRFLRQLFLQYPYFRLNVLVFDEREKSKQTKNSSEAMFGNKLNKEIAGKTIEENNLVPFVKPDDRALFAFHPHGVLPNGFAFNGAHHMGFVHSHCRWLVSENLFWFPVIKDLLNWMDFSCVAKSTFHRFMSTGQNVCFLPGGFEEATLYERGKHRVYIKKRFGFIKLALQHGYKVHPVYTFGEEYTYHTFPYLLQLRLKFNEFKIPVVLFYGLLRCFFLPCSDVDLITVVGEGLVMPRIEQPTKEHVRKYHAQYVDALQKLFDKYKCAYAVDPDAKLEMY